jgi:hypothetical protein
MTCSARARHGLRAGEVRLGNEVAGDVESDLFSFETLSSRRESVACG